ncbi:MAG TPA: DsrE family protein [Beijerinckiaceae bacterium]|nr:DsrE family protein [Beijerinckiaceae bacterium]
MDRRAIGKAALATIAGLFTAARARAAMADAGMAKVVYHLADLDKVTFVLGNIANHYEGMGGPDKVTIALVIHGPALKAFHVKGADAAHARRFAQFVKNGLAPAVCIHSMQAQNVKLEDLMPGFAVADRGGVVRLAELQAQGYAYLRP